MCKITVDAEPAAQAFDRQLLRSYKPTFKPVAVDSKGPALGTTSPNSVPVARVAGLRLPPGDLAGRAGRKFGWRCTGNDGIAASFR